MTSWPEGGRGAEVNPVPDFAEEEKLWGHGYRFVAGIDEVGRGPLAGPVMAAAVILPTPFSPPWLPLVRDSKELTPKRREALFHLIQEQAVAVGVGAASVEVIDSQGIVAATRQAMVEAISQLSPVPAFLLIDSVTLPTLPLPQKSLKRGDSQCLSIACASIVAKVTRDRLMAEMDRLYPGYGFARHKGYGTTEHLLALRRQGVCPLHRRSFGPVRGVLDGAGA